MSKSRDIFLVTTITAFWGTVLAIPDFSKYYAFRLCLVLHLLSIMYLVITGGWKSRFAKQQVLVRDYLWFYAGWLLWALISISWVDSPTDGLRQLFALFCGITMLSSLVVYIDSPCEANRYVRVFLATLALFSGIGLWEHFTGLHIRNTTHLDPRIYANAYTFPTAVFANTNDFATFLALYLPFPYIGLRRESPVWARVLCLLLLVSGCFLLKTTDSRANVLALGLMSVCAVLLYLSRLPKRIIAFLAGGLVFLSILAGSSLCTPQGQKVIAGVSSKLIKTDERGSSDQIRLSLAKGGLQLLKEHHYLGVGAGNLEFHMRRYWLETRGLINMHNYWLEVLVNYGVFLWAFFLAFYFKLLANLLTVVRHSAAPQLRNLAEACLLSLIGFSIGSISSSGIIGQIFPWILFGFSLAVYNLYLNEPVLKPENKGN